MQPEVQTMIRLFNTVSDTVGDGVSPEKMERYERYILSLVCDKKSARYTLPKRAVWVAALIVPLVVVSTIWLFFVDEKPIPFSVGKGELPGVVGKWMNTDTDETTPLSFDQGSTFLVYPRSELRVLESNEKSVKVDLKKGSLFVAINGNGTTRWSVSAGPYKVTVLGTKFMVAWNLEEQVLDVKVDQGTVLVQGTEIGDNGIQVTKGHHFRADQRTGLLAVKTVNSDYYNPKEITLVSADADWDKEHRPPNEKVMDTGPVHSPTPKSEINAETQPDETRVPVLVSGSRSSSENPEMMKAPSVSNANAHNSSTNPKRYNQESMDALFKKPLSNEFIKRSNAAESLGIDEKPSQAAQREMSKNWRNPDKPKAGSPKTKWLLQYNQGRYDLALEEAQKLGIEALLSSLDVNALWKLIYAARASGQDEVAMEALAACRRRFKSNKKAKIAAFLVGKIYFDQNSDLITASKWFSLYLAEDPNGPLAEEALGRLVVIFEQLGKVTNAKKSAQHYLQKYPNGSFEGNARSVLKR